MKKYFLKPLALALALTMLFSFDMPAGWMKAGSKPEKYEMGVEKGSGQHGQNAATIKSSAKKIDGFGTLMQTVSSKKFAGKRVRMSGQLKSTNVSGWCGFWLRVDSPVSSEAMSFDNMHDGVTDRSVKGTTDWTKYEIVLDVPEGASQLAFGALLVGTGQIWFDHITFEEVDGTVPVTGMPKGGRDINTEPENLDFED